MRRFTAGTASSFGARGPARQVVAVTYDAVVAHAAQRTRLRRQTASKAVLDCPVCHGKRKLDIREGTQGAVVFKCHRECGKQTILDALGLEWRDLWEIDNSYQPQPSKVSAEKLVLNALSGERWTICTHDFQDEDEELGVWLIEHLLPARAKAGLKYPWQDFPLTVKFAQKAFRKLGRPLGQKRVARIINVIEDRGRIVRPTWFHKDDPTAGFDRFRVYSLPDAAVAKWFDTTFAKVNRPISSRLQALLKLWTWTASTSVILLSAAAFVSSALRRELAHAQDLLERLQQRKRLRQVCALGGENK